MNINKNAGRQPQHRYFVNYHIRSANVVCIDDEDKNLGIITLTDAVKLAQSKSLDLVLVSPGKNGSPPICKILDFGKFRYEQDKKEKITKKRQRENIIKIKEIKFRPNTDDNDLKIKANQMLTFLNEGNKVKITVTFKGREIAHKEIGTMTLKKFINMLPDFQFEMEPQISGRQLTAVLIKKQTSEKSNIG